MAGVVGGFQLAGFIKSPYSILFHIHQAHHVKDLFHAAHHGLHALGGAQVDILALVRQLCALHGVTFTHCAEIDRVGIVRPDGPGVNAEPAVLAVYRQLGAHFYLGILRSSGMQPFLQLAHIIRRKEIL